MLTRSCSLEVKIFSAREDAGVAGAAIAAEVIRAEIARNGKAAVVFASAVSQDPFLAAVRVRDDIDWKRITSFHLDEYAGMSDRHPASFRRFDEPRDVRPVDLDDVCRMQQVHDGQFASFDEVPKQALSLTVPFFLRVPRALVFVNGERKAVAVQAALEGPITEACPASALRRHPNATMFLDQAAASRLG